MLAKLNQVAKALVAFAVPAGAFAADIGADWLTISEDGFVDGTEWWLLLVAVAAGVGTYFTRNAAPA